MAAVTYFPNWHAEIGWNLKSSRMYLRTTDSKSARVISRPSGIIPYFTNAKDRLLLVKRSTSVTYFPSDKHKWDRNFVRSQGFTRLITETTCWALVCFTKSSWKPCSFAQIGSKTLANRSWARASPDWYLCVKNTTALWIEHERSSTKRDKPSNHLCRERSWSNEQFWVPTVIKHSQYSCRSLNTSSSGGRTLNADVA